MKITGKKIGWALVLGLALIIAGSLLVGPALAATPTPTPPPNGNYGYGMASHQLDLVAKLLGTSTQDLVGQLQQGKTLVQIAQGKGVSEQQLVDTLMAPQKDELALRVKYGYITQDQANSLLPQMTANVKTAINSTWNESSGGYGFDCPGYGLMGFGSGFGGMMSGFGSGFRGMLGGSGGGNGAGYSGHGGMMGGSGASYGASYSGMMGGFAR